MSGTHLTSAALDPVCGMTVDPVAPKGGSLYHKGKRYGFCNAHCLTRFKENPASFLTPRILDPQQAEKGLYTCPMHPEIRQTGGGPCPVCGMVLEPLAADAAPEDSELIDFTRRLFISVLFFVPLMVMDMSSMTASPLLQLLLAVPVMWAGTPIFKRFWLSIQHRSLNMFSLIGLGAGTAFIYSTVVVLMGDRMDSIYFEAAAAIITFVLLGQVLELKARRQTSSALRRLLDLSPKMARLIPTSGPEVDVPLAAVRVGDRLRVRPGERVPTDGILIEGKSAVDESLLTGESIPLTKEPGSRVTGGTINGLGGFVMEVRQVGEDTALARIVRLVAQAQRSRAPIQRLADRVAGFFVPAVVATAILTACVWGLLGPQPRVMHAVVNAVAVLIIACPCALGLATPMSVMVGVGRASEAGVLVRDAAALEALEQVDVLLLDKTGTLTEGKPRLSTIAALANFRDTEVVGWAAALESASEHPLAAALTEAAKERRQIVMTPLSFESFPGQGVSGLVDGKRIRLGTAPFLASASIDVRMMADIAERMRGRGEIVIFMAVDQQPAALLGISDPLKPKARETIDALKSDGLRVIMLTGDHETTAQAIATRLGLSEIRANMRPEDKIAAVKKLQAEGLRVAMAGDGINDAPALAQANVGLAMATGTDVAMESSGITLIGGDLAAILKARRLSRAVMRNIRQNLFFAFIYNLVGVPLAAGVLYPAFGLLLSPVIGAAAMSLSSVSVIANALRLRRTYL